MARLTPCVPLPLQSHEEDIQSPNGMIIDSSDYLGATDDPLLEKDDVAIINTDTPDNETDQLPDPPRADDCTSPHVPATPFLPVEA